MITVRTCPKCKILLSDTWQYCPQCGANVPTPASDEFNQHYRSESDLLVDQAKKLYFDRKYIEAWNKSMMAADMGNGEAYFMIGFLIARRHGYQKGTDAMTWYKKGVEKNNAAAMNAMGVLYFNGNHVSKDIDTAISFFQKAADLGDMFAPYNLARCYELGIGVPQDRDQAIEFFMLAIERGNDYAGDYFETKFFKPNVTEVESEEQDDLYGYVFSKERWGYLEKTIHFKNATCRIFCPLYPADYYKKNADIIKQFEEGYRRECIYKLPELTIM